MSYKGKGYPGPAIVKLMCEDGVEREIRLLPPAHESFVATPACACCGRKSPWEADPGRECYLCRCGAGFSNVDYLYRMAVRIQRWNERRKRYVVTRRVEWS